MKQKIQALIIHVACLFLITSLQAASPPNWMDPLISQEFARYKRGITSEMIEVTWKKLSRNPFCKRYKVVRSKVYGPDTSIRRLLQVLVQKYPVPDVDFIYYHQDILPENWFSKKWEKQRAPVFTSAKHKSSSRSILFVDWYYDIMNQDAGWNAQIRDINANYNLWEWDKKLEILFWRGSTADGCYTWNNWTSFPRGRLVYESQNQNCKDIDAAFIGVANGCYDQWPIALASFIPPVEQLQYKYHIDIDGVTCTYPALQWKLLSGCLVFKQASDDTMWFHPKLIPWKHFIPVQKDLSDVQEKITWAKTHDREAQEIAEAGREFALTHLMPEHILLYCYKALCKYAALQKLH